MTDKVPNKNRFAGVGNQFDDSDDEAKPITKTQKKKEERKVEAAPQKVAKVNNQNQDMSGFNVVNNQRP